jgi:predicted Rossmann-fold nucleotide-binding protein
MMTKTIAMNHTMFRKGDKIKLIDGSIGTVEEVVRAETINVYRIILHKSGEERYFEESKLTLYQKKSVSNIWQKIRTIFHKN